MLLNYRNIFPDNLLQAAFQHTKTEYVNKGFVKEDALGNTSYYMNVTKVTASSGENMTNEVHNKPEIKWVRTFPMADGINVLGVYFTTVSLFYIFYLSSFAL